MFNHGAKRKVEYETEEQAVSEFKRVITMLPGFLLPKDMKRTLIMEEIDFELDNDRIETIIEQLIQYKFTGVKEVKAVTDGKRLSISYIGIKNSPLE